MKILVIGDSHITEDSIPELTKVFDEIRKIKADIYIQLGDFFDKKKPTPAEILFATQEVYKLKQTYKDVYILKGNHPSITQDLSSVDYLQYVGAEVCADVKLKLNNATYYFGHFFTDESIDLDIEKQHLADIKADVVVLGHYHISKQLQTTPKNAFHVGSCRYIRFDEVINSRKYVVLIEDAETQDIQWIPIESVIPMKEVQSLKELPNIDANTKVRWVIKDWETYKAEINNPQLTELSAKFVQFKIKFEFQEQPEAIKETIASKTESKIDLKSFIETWLSNLSDKDVKSELEAEFKKEGQI
jgi:DNA repair exonuclease SbcCD nuclease subunit